MAFQVLCSVTTCSGQTWLHADTSLCKTADGKEERLQGISQDIISYTHTSEPLILALFAFVSGGWS